MSKDWFEEEVSKEHKNKVFLSVDPLLKERKKEYRSYFGRAWLGLGGMATAAIAGVLFWKGRQPAGPGQQVPMELAQFDQEFLEMDQDFLMDLELLEALDELEADNG